MEILGCCCSWKFYDSRLLLLSAAVHGNSGLLFMGILGCCSWKFWAAVHGNENRLSQSDSSSDSGHLAAMMGPPGGPGGVEVGYPSRTPVEARVYAAPGDVPASRTPPHSRLRRCVTLVITYIMKVKLLFFYVFYVSSVHTREMVNTAS
jgi:hypothetical protein